MAIRIKETCDPQMYVNEVGGTKATLREPEWKPAKNKRSLADLVRKALNYKEKT